MPFPSSSQYVPLKQKGAIVIDPVRDVSPDETDIVGSAEFPAAYYAYDGTNVYFRLRLNADPRFKNDFRNFAWGVLFDTDNNPSAYEWELVVNGLDNQLALIANTVKIPNDFSDQAEGTDGRGAASFAETICNFDIVRAQMTDDGSNLGGSENYFIDFFIPSNTLFSLLGITDQSSLRFLFFTATNNNNFNKDFIGTGQVLSALFCDPVTIAGGDVRAKLSVSQSVSTPAAIVTAGLQTTFAGTITIANTGRSTATTIYVQAPFLFDKFISFAVTQSSVGSAAFNNMTGTLTWNVGNLAAESSATLTYQAAGLFTTAGARTVDTKTVTGIDSFTGAAISGSASSATVNVAVLGGATGTILDKSTGLPLPGVTVQASSVPGNIPAPAGQTASNGGGVYSFPSLPPGSYNLTFTLPDYQPATAAANVTADTVQTVNVTLNPQPATVQGTVTALETGSPIAGAMVNVTNSIAVRVAQAAANASGNYSIPNLVPGYYRVSFSADNYQSRDVPVNLTIGETRTLDAALPPSPGSINGTITNAQTGALLAGALVEALDNRNSVIATATANAAGAYAIDSLAPATNDRLRVSADTFVTQVFGFSIQAGQTKTINAALSPVAGSLAGTLTDSATGAVLAGASIRVFTSEGVTLQTTMTAVDGSYTIISLQPGSYSIVIANEGYAGQTIGAMIAAGAVTTLNAALQQLAGAINGTITSVSGAPIADAIIRVFSNNIIVVRVASREDGTYDIGNLAPGTYFLSVRAEGFGGLTFGVTVNPGETTKENFVLAPNPGSLTGFILDPNNNPIAGAVLSISLNVSGGGLIISRFVSQTDGAYLIENLFPAPYLLTVSAQSFQSAFQSVTVASDSQSAANFILQPNPGRLSGTVVDNNGIPVAGAAVLVKTSTGNGVTIATIFSDPNGLFETSGLAPGNYTILGSAPNLQSASATVAVRSDESTPVSLVLFPDPGSIQGQVSDALTGLPIFGVLVSVTDSNNFQVASVIADENNNFRFDGLPPGSYTVAVRALNYQSGTLGAIVSSNSISPVDFALQPNPGIILGTVTPPLGGALVQLYNSNNILISTAISDPEGSFGFLGEQVGSYYLTAVIDGFSSQIAGATVLPGRTTQATINLVPNPGEISGRIVDTSGQPIPTAIVKVLNGNESIRGISPVQGDGSYIAEGMQPGPKTIIASAPNFSNQIKGQNVGPGQLVTGVDFVLSRDPGTVSGQITDQTAGQTIAGASVEIRVNEASGLSVAAAMTTRFGNYQISGLAPGTYTVIAKANGFAVGTVGITVASNAFTIANMALNPLFGTINGAVTDTTGSPIDSNDTKIKLYTLEGALIETAFVNSDGTFSLTGVLPGEYIITASAPGFETTTLGVTVFAGGISQATLPLSPQTSSVIGVVRDSSSLAPISGALVNLIDIGGLPVETTFTDNSGSFALFGIPTGNFVVSAIASGFGAATAAVVTQGGQTAVTELLLTPQPGAVTGFVSDFVSGANISGAEIRISNESSGAAIGTVLSNNGGQYGFNSLSPARFKAVASANGYAPEFGGFTIRAEETTRFSFALQPLPGRIAGTVTNAATGSPLAGATVQLLQFNNFGPALLSALTDNGGRFDLGAVAAANYAVTVSLDGFVTRQSSVIVGRGETADLPLALRQGSTGITGIVNSGSTGQPIPNSSVSIVDNNGVIGGNGITDNKGNYVIPSIPAGEQSVVVTTPSAGTSSTFLPERLGQIQTADLAVAGPVSPISCRITDDANGAPIPGAIVSVLDASSNTLIQTVITDLNGQCTTNPIAPGDYTLTCSAPNYGSNATASDVVAQSGLQLSTQFGTLRGTIRDISGRPLELALAEIVKPNPRLIRQMISNSTGQYAFTNIAAGMPNAVFSFPGKQTAQFMPTIVNGQTTILDVVLLDEDEE